MWNLLPHERLRTWQEFRNSVSEMPPKEALDKIEHLWSYAPYVKNYLHYDLVNEFPGPWELIYDNYYCNLAKALGIMYTVYLSGQDVDVEIRVYIDESSTEQYNLVYIDKGKYVLNLIHDEVVNSAQVPNNLKLKKTITSTELGLDNLL